MTKLEFQPIFKRLMKDYGVEKKMNAGQVDSFFDYLRRYDKDDFLGAARRMPALEISTAYKPFPTAECMQKYILDAQEERLHREKQSYPASFEELARRASRAKDWTPGERAYQQLCKAYIVWKIDGRRGPGPTALAKTVWREQAEWLGHPSRTTLKRHVEAMTRGEGHAVMPDEPKAANQCQAPGCWNVHHPHQAVDPPYYCQTHREVRQLEQHESAV